MFPYFEQPTLQIGPVTLHSFGALVALGALLGYGMLVRRAGQRGLDANLAADLALWMMIPGFFTAHLAFVFFYSPPGRVLEDPFSLVRIWDGISSIGGIAGGILGGWVLLRRRKLSSGEIWKYIDAVAYAFPFAWILGRAGCSVAHDHPGIETASWLAVQYPEGARFDLGLLEFFYTIVTVGTFLLLDRRPRPTGFYFTLFMLLYGPVRFYLDTLRINEVRHFGLTFAQYGSVVATLVGIVTLILIMKRRLVPSAR